MGSSNVTGNNINDEKKSDGWYFLNTDKKYKKRTSLHWDEEEIKTFTDGIKKYGVNDGAWGKIGKLVKYRTGSQCFRFYTKNILNDKIIDFNFFINKHKVTRLNKKINQEYIKYAFIIKSDNGQYWKHQRFPKNVKQIRNELLEIYKTENNIQTDIEDPYEKYLQDTEQNTFDDPSNNNINNDESNNINNDESNDNNNDDEKELLAGLPGCLAGVKRKREDGNGDQIQPKKKTKRYRENDNELLPGYRDIITNEQIQIPYISPYHYVLGIESWQKVLGKDICPFTGNTLQMKHLIKITKENDEIFIPLIKKPDMLNFKVVK